MANASGSSPASRSRTQPAVGSPARREELHTSWEEREMEEERDRIESMLRDGFGHRSEEREDWDFEDETAPERNRSSKKRTLASGDRVGALAAGEDDSPEITSSIFGKPVDRDVRNARTSMRAGVGNGQGTKPRVSLEGLVDVESDWEQLLEAPDPALPVLRSRKQQSSSQPAGNQAPSPHQVPTPPPSRASEAENNSSSWSGNMDIQDRLHALSARLGDLLPREAANTNKPQPSKSPTARAEEQTNQAGSSSSRGMPSRFQGMPTGKASENRSPVTVGDLISMRMSPLRNTGDAVSKSLSGLDEKPKPGSRATPISLSSSLQFSRQTDSFADGTSQGRQDVTTAKHAWKVGSGREKEEEEEVDLMDEEVELVDLDDSFTPMKDGISLGGTSPGNAHHARNNSQLPVLEEDPDWLLEDMGNAATDENMNISKSPNTSKERSSPLGEDAYDKIIEQFHQLQRNVAATLHESLTHLDDEDDNEDAAQPRQNLSGSSQEDRMMADLSRKYLRGKTAAEAEEGEEDGAAFLHTPPKRCSGLTHQGSMERGREFEDDIFAESDSFLLESSPP